MTQRRKRTQGFSTIRIGLIAGGIGVGFIVLGVLAFLGDQAARRAPFDVALYPGAQEWGLSDLSEASRTVLYRVPGVDPQLVANWYQLKLNEHNGDDSGRCVRVPPAGEYPVDPSNPLSIPYRFTCVFDNSSINSQQFTQVVIYPGVANPDPDKDSSGMAVIEYQQRWTP